MAELRGDRGALAVDGVGESPQRDGGLRVEDEAVPVDPPFRRHGAIGDRRHAHPAGGDGAVELDQLVGDLPPRRRSFGGGRFHEPVAQSQRPEPPRREGLSHGRTISDALSETPV